VLHWLIGNSLALIGLLATLALLLVTYLSTKASQAMAVTAKKAAEESARATAAAERSAQAALDAARVAQSQIRVEFTGRLIAIKASPVSIPTVELESAADPVVVQRVRCRRAFRQGADGLQPEPDLTNTELTAIGEIQLPRRLHPGEKLHLTHTSMQQGEFVARFLLDVDYTFSVDGGIGATRQLIVSGETRR
jgi:hypothetical protein